MTDEIQMGLMQPHPLLISSLIVHAERIMVMVRLSRGA
ncbi:hypothetical protein TKWG_18115 [Advenella kashmirensis WT001]|uniref:Uncharacterized protein n=1 Tax=Advenella kashmirensis (strain DSM 17095 / LMG 22695 / WT001) TaxID=1036672 RepID=I3UER1_ADVKW|nr:hypothetical protein TKWG_18115 [Advenella kashmirensis WT001]